jgi:hypothetical protein
MVSAPVRRHILTPLAALAALATPALAGPPVHETLSEWLRDGGLGGAEYRARGLPERPADWPGWLLRPAGPDALSLAFLDRGLHPEATTLDWHTEHGVVAIHGVRGDETGLHLVVDRNRQRPLLLRTGAGTVWELRGYRPREGRLTGLPARIVRRGPEGEETVFRRRD